MNLQERLDIVSGRQQHHKGKQDFASTLKLIETFLATNESRSRSTRFVAPGLSSNHLDVSQSTSDAPSRPKPSTSSRNISVPPTPDVRSLIEDTARTELLRLNISELRQSVLRLLENSYYLNYIFFLI